MGVFKIPTPNPTLPKNGFDLSSRRVFSAPAGALLPVGCWETNPNEHFQISVQDLVRTQPLNTAAYTRCKEYYHFFFVPYKSLWRFSDLFFTGVSNGDSAFIVPIFKSKNQPIDYNDKFNWTPKTLPHFNFGKLLKRFYEGQRKDALGYSFSNGAFRLLNMLEYGVTCDGEAVDNSVFGSSSGSIKYIKNPTDNKGLNCTPNPFRLFAYQRIYNDFYRNQQWEKSDVISFNCDYAQDDEHLDLTLDSIESACTLRYRQWPKDWLTSSVPSPNYNEGIFNLPSYLGNKGISVHRDSNGDGVFFDNKTDLPSLDGVTPLDRSNNLSVSDIRAAFALDKMLEVTRRANGLDYSSQIAAHFGFKVPESRRHCAQFIGGFDNQVVVDEVTATANGSVTSGSSSSSSVVGQVFGKGIGSMNSNTLSFDTKEHGLIMCIYSVVPQVDYNSFYMSNFNRKLTREQFYQPEFQDLGYTPLNGYDMVMVSGDPSNTFDNNSILGFVPRYQEYKCGRDIVFGEFMSSKSLSAWTTPRTDFFRTKAKSVSLTPADLMIDPKVLDSVFSVAYDGHPKFDQFLVNSFFNIKAVRPMSVTGLSLI
ncbi:major capsid protein [Prevotella corporis]|uniref:major capsid protein n=1 Tax=Prevotella corporis TaxID=28128 RepID=UPI0023664AE1|nr:major capsid protein [Prevotella corporis]